MRVQGKQARLRGSPFALINGATAEDVLCIDVPEGVSVEGPIHVLYITSGPTQEDLPNSRWARFRIVGCWGVRSRNAK